MHPLDLSIVAAYLLVLVVAGVWMARRAGSSSEHYFLGGRRLPWWALGSSGMSSNLDVAGTMTIVALITVYGLHGFWIEMRGGVVLPIAVSLMGMPGLAVPVTLDAGAPIGVQIVAARFQDEACLTAAEAIEARSSMIKGPIDPSPAIQKPKSAPVAAR